MNISKIHYITQNTTTLNHLQATEIFCLGGADWVQVRIKNEDKATNTTIAKAAKTITDKYNAQLIINDHVELAKEVGAAGVHLGKNDRSPKEARELLGEGFIIGGTANTFADVQYLVEQGVDYIGFGPFRFTETKKNLSPVVGLEGYINLIKACKEANITTPIIGIGGITDADVAQVMNTGIHGIALSGEVLNAAEPIEKAEAIDRLVYKK